ncbi:lytic transglycosylase domain-containing protein [Hydrogenophaga sp.]|uniref:lytic transglycosylase domain-containing protein n=1 Tax=Hydrogenophaga sp. TaxID=1904254 RepID=UPI0019A75627|nr:lytic transglycosylase domain-containing protein [Hydrogenophaga sp.]MBD3893979.1 lytic transglycosylase domain-containing protein [Hydrogenophaga sp.]
MTEQNPNPATTAQQSSVLTRTCRGVWQGLTLLGLLLLVAAVTLSLRPELRSSAELHLLAWLTERQEAVFDELAIEPDPQAIDRVTAAYPGALPKAQANVTRWLSRKYRVAPEPLSVLVAEAFYLGEKVNIDPSLILAVMAIESRFNPFAQSPMGAQGLMQVMTRVHSEKFEDFGGKLAAFDPVSNLRVGVMVLQDGIRRTGSVEGALRAYVGAVSTDGRWYIDRVLAEQKRIQRAARGLPMPRQIAQYRPAAAAAVPAAAPAQTPQPAPAALDGDAELLPAAAPAPLVTPEPVLSQS